MVMKASLQLKMGQSLTMTPQLQQAIRLLQLSTLDLQQEIQQALESNPMLETSEDDDQSDTPDTDADTRDEHKDRDSDHDEPATEAASDWDENENGPDWASENDIPDNIPDDLPVDTAWDDIYQSAPAPASKGDDENESDFETRNSPAETLQDHLEWQLNLTPMSERDQAIAHALMDAVDERGYLTSAIEEIHSGLQDETEEDPLELDEVEAVLHRLQHFDPPGVFARDLQECLLIQLNQLPPDTPWLRQARLVVTQFLHLLGNRDYAQLLRRSRLKEDQLREVLALITSLNPRPGDVVDRAEPDYVIPDVIVRKHEGRWRVELNPEIAPRIRVNASYASLIRRADSSADNTYLRDQLQEAKWFIKSLQSRNETLLKVATRIVEHQQGFLDQGEEAMKPLILSDIAQAVEMHESTISRVTTQKYMHTPRGIFELKYFFSSHVSTAEGGECSSTAIRAMIKKLISEETPKKPLSDSKIAAMLGDQGINVARRTVAKYREAMHIPPSNERKRLV
ncbi:MULTISPECIES: RNA polymerase factor sigma-54 [unclassified Marinobacter]|uniref:RNA polymerase factor sigma-54 n=1 Tax=unclassified Marinobacter TaxID=83889 RepID=UPI0012AA8162|nr:MULTISPECIES: RNA polymerase factor sigma-54 [unclassified Marinobacter]QFS87829.1 RNA polymerase sigma-54 factor [Marinobacter sp. THAF197a]QFT51614.1 RNA polymerase sigma-54 factor [Marinobacter sp. THAF39]